MEVLIVPMRRLGRELTKQERGDAVPIKGDVYVQCVQDSQLGRATNQAHVRPRMPRDPDPLPPLSDARLSGMATLGFVISGYETIDGCTYAQSWWCRLP